MEEGCAHVWVAARFGGRVLGAKGTWDAGSISMIEWSEPQSLFWQP